MRYHADPSTTHNYISNKERLKLSPTRDSNLRHHKRAIFIEKEYPEIEKTNKYLIDNVDPVIKRGQSRISWNLDENDNRETTTTNEVEAMNFNNNNNHDMYQINMDRRVRPSSSSQHITLPHSRQNGSTISRQTATLQSQSKYRTPVDDESIDGNDHIESRRYKRNKYYPATIATTKNNINLTSYPPTENMLPRPDTELEAEDKPEQVYVCRCCGLACELAPSVRYLHRFRVAFFVFNFLVLVFGVANFGMGLWFRIDPKVYELHKYIQTNNYTSAGWIMLFAGFAVTIIALVGFRAAAKSKPGYLIFYFVMVAIVTLLLMGALVLVTVYGLGESLEQFATKEVFQQIQNKTRSDKSAQFLDFIQIKVSSLCFEL